MKQQEVAPEERLRANGYVAMPGIAAMSALLGQHPVLTPASGTDPLGVMCAKVPHPLVLLVLTPIQDAELARRVRALLDAHGLTSGPCRVTEKAMCWPLRYRNYDLTSKKALDAVIFVHQNLGIAGNRCPAVLPLDGDWQGSLFETRAEQLPQVTDEQIDALLKEIAWLPATLEVERRPKLRPCRAGWLGYSTEQTISAATRELIARGLKLARENRGGAPPADDIQDAAVLRSVLQTWLAGHLDRTQPEAICGRYAEPPSGRHPLPDLPARERREWDDFDASTQEIFTLLANLDELCAKARAA